MLLTLFIVQKAFLSNTLFQHFHGDRCLICADLSVGHCHLQCVQRGSGISGSKHRDHIQHMVINIHIQITQSLLTADGNL